MFDVFYSLPITTLTGHTIHKDGIFKIRHKKPRSSKWLETAVHPSQVLAALVGKEGYIVFRKESTEYVGSCSKLENAGDGLLLAVTAEGDKVYVNAATVTREADEATAEKGKRRKAVEDDEEEAPRRRRKA